MQLDTKRLWQAQDDPHVPFQSFSILFNPFQSFSILFNPFQSFSILFNQGKLRFQVSRTALMRTKMRTLPCQSVCPRMVFLSQRPKVIQRSGIRRFTHGRRINSVPDAKHQRIGTSGTMRKWEAHGSTIAIRKKH